jgi:hypothetical protein
MKAVPVGAGEDFKVGAEVAAEVRLWEEQVAAEAQGS